MPEGYLWSFADSVACFCSVFKAIWAWLISAGPSPFILLFSAIVAFATYRSNQNQITKRATLDTITEKQAAKSYLEGRRFFNYYAARDPRALCCLTNKIFSQYLREALITHLNVYEEMAGGVSQGILDEDYFKTLMKSLVVETWHKGAFFMYQHSWERDLDTGVLLKIEGKPKYKAGYFSELKELADQYGADSKLFPENDGTWNLETNDIENLLGVLRIREPDGNGKDGYSQMCADLASMTKPLEPEELAKIAERRAYHSDGRDEGQVLDEKVRDKDWAPKTVEHELAEIVEAIGKLTDNVAPKSAT